MDRPPRSSSPLDIYLVRHAESCSNVVDVDYLQMTHYYLQPEYYSVLCCENTFIQTR